MMVVIECGSKYLGLPVAALEHIGSAVELEKTGYQPDAPFRVCTDDLIVQLVKPSRIIGGCDADATAESMARLIVERDQAKADQDKAESALRREKVFWAKRAAAHAKGLTDEEWRAQVTAASMWTISTCEPVAK